MKNKVSQSINRILFKWFGINKDKYYNKFCLNCGRKLKGYQRKFCCIDCSSKYNVRLIKTKSLIKCDSCNEWIHHKEKTYLICQDCLPLSESNTREDY